MWCVACNVCPCMRVCVCAPCLLLVACYASTVCICARCSTVRTETNLSSAASQWMDITCMPRYVRPAPAGWPVSARGTDLAEIRPSPDLPRWHTRDANCIPIRSSLVIVLSSHPLLLRPSLLIMLSSFTRCDSMQRLFFPPMSLNRPANFLPDGWHDRRPPETRVHIATVRPYTEKGPMQEAW